MFMYFATVTGKTTNLEHKHDSSLTEFQSGCFQTGDMRRCQLGQRAADSGSLVSFFTF